MGELGRLTVQFKSPNGLLNAMGTIYRIRNLIDGKVYIGQALNFEKRKSRHLWELRCGRHKNEHLQRAWLFHGERNFAFEILESGLSPNALTDAEQRQIDSHRSADWTKGYNKSPAAGSNITCDRAIASPIADAGSHCIGHPERHKALECRRRCMRLVRPRCALCVPLGP